MYGGGGGDADASCSFGGDAGPPSPPDASRICVDYAVKGTFCTKPLP
jgi:hypothetical protein